MGANKPEKFKSIDPYLTFIIINKHEQVNSKRGPVNPNRIQCIFRRKKIFILYDTYICIRRGEYICRYISRRQLTLSRNLEMLVFSGRW